MSSITRLANFIRLIVLSGRALFLCVIGGLLIDFAVWLVLPDGRSWLLDVIAAFVGWKGLEVINLGLDPFARKPNPQQVAAPSRTAAGEYNNRAVRGREQGLWVPHGQRARRY
ncbi:MULTISPECIES: hypothetical protein [unclassified Bradyrhizobium]|uniref:hypothetical protein n=1 Tax=unclassified Bradyrhizobium TaxID=2631580 RepID=UPI0028E4607F|nr:MULTISPECIES: hypothetical protein [unclassified Bradyrhizobium]